jgi:hypothetical protein
MKPDQAAATASKLFNALEPAFLIGWVKGPQPYDGPSLFIAITSWLMVAGSALFGASFWFDILQRITHVKGTGPKPERSDTPPGLVSRPSVTSPEQSTKPRQPYA